MAYDITIEATVRKTIRIEEDVNEEDAIIRAHELFTVNSDDTPEKYDEETIDIKEVK